MSKLNKFVGSSKKNPCVICGRTKDDKCRAAENESLYLCGTEVNSRKVREEFNGFIFLGESECGTWGKWILKSEDWVKSRPPGKSYRYPFFDINGNRLVEEVRTIDANGKKRSPWMEPSGCNTALLTPYRYAEALKALQNGAEYCLILEGPPKADIAWDLGIPAIAFANGFKLSRDSHWFEGFEDRLVLVPDQDRPGVSKLEKMADAYPMAKEFKPYPDSAWWDGDWIPKSGGKDFKDWVEQLRSRGEEDVGIVAMIQPYPRKVEDNPLRKEAKPLKIEQEFEQVKVKFTKQTKEVEELTEKWENAPEGKEKRDAKQRLQNAKDLAKLSNSALYNTRLEIKRLVSNNDSDLTTGYAKDQDVIIRVLAERLSYNLLNKSIYLDGSEQNFNSTCLWLTEKTGHVNWNKSDSSLALVILDLAKKNEFCPVKKYLESIQAEDRIKDWDELSFYLFGTKSPVASAAFKAQLIGSVRRIYEPGCHHRLMPILFGGQKKGKSTFLRNLYAGFSSEGDLPMRDKDGAMIIQRTWAHEVAECDSIFGTREASSLKSFVSLKEDIFRAPYERSVGVHPRRSVLWGTTNKKALFTDTTGNTRYPIIALADNYSIPNDWVLANRGKIWVTAWDAYRRGEFNEMPEDLVERQEEEAGEYAAQDVLFDPVESYLRHQPIGAQLCLDEVTKHLGYDLHNCTRTDQNRITAIMRQLGWDNKVFKADGKAIRRWARS